MSDRPTDMTAGLGQLIASYDPVPAPRVSPIRLVAWAAIGLVAAGAAVWFQPSWPWLLLASGPSLLVLVDLLRCRQSAARIHLHQRGLVWQSGRRPRVLFWNQVGELYCGARRWSHRRGSRRGECSWRVVGHDGQQWRLEGFEGLRSLGLRIQTELTRRQLPSAVEAWRSGYPVRFGSELSVYQAGLQLGTRLVRWYEVREIALDEMLGVRIRYTSPTASTTQLEATEVPNLGLLAALLDAIRTEPAGERPAPRPRDQSDSQLLAAGGLDEGCDPNDLLLAGYDWDDVRSVLQGDCTLEDLLARGPRRRPRRPK